MCHTVFIIYNPRQFEIEMFYIWEEEEEEYMMLSDMSYKKKKFFNEEVEE